MNLADCMSFVFTNNYGSTTTMAYDSDFQGEGFDVFKYRRLFL